MAAKNTGVMNATGGEIVLYQSWDRKNCMEVKKGGEMVWLRQEQIADLFWKDFSGISRHISKIFADGKDLADLQLCCCGQ